MFVLLSGGTAYGVMQAETVETVHRVVGPHSMVSYEWFRAVALLSIALAVCDSGGLSYLSNFLQVANSAILILRRHGNVARHIIVDAFVQSAHARNVVMHEGGSAIGSNVEVGGAAPARRLRNGQGVGFFVAEADATECQQQFAGDVQYRLLADAAQCGVSQ